MTDGDGVPDGDGVTDGDGVVTDGDGVPDGDVVVSDGAGVVSDGEGVVLDWAVSDAGGAEEVVPPWIDSDDVGPITATTSLGP